MRLRIFAILFSLLLLPMAANALELGARGYFWAAGISSDLKVHKGGAGTRVDLTGELGVEDEYLPVFEVYGGVGDHHLALAYTPLSFSGSDTLARDIRVNGVTFPEGEKTGVTFDLKNLDLTYRYDLLDLENFLAGFSFGPALGLKYLDGTTEYEGVLGVTAKDDFKALLPTVGLWTHIGILADILEARGQLTGMVTGSGKVVDGLFEVVVTPFVFLDVGLGYRYLLIDSSFGGTDMDSEFKGLYLTLAAGW